MREEKILINNLEVNYKIAGEGTPFLILHGWGRGSDSWIQVQKILANQGCKVIVPDLPGFGKSRNPPKPWGIDDYVEFVNDFTTNFQLESFFLFGSSFGGRIAIKFAAKYPTRILKLMLYGAAGIKHRRTSSQFVSLLISEMAKKFAFLPFYSFSREMFYRFIIRKKDYLEAKGVMKDTFLKVIEHDLTPYLSRISVPTFIIWGEKDKITPLSDAYLIKKMVPNSELKIIPELGHAFHNVAPEKLTEAVSQFIKSQN